MMMYQHSQLGSYYVIPFCKLQNCFFEFVSFNFFKIAQFL